jgi:hypothetical protein
VVCDPSIISGGQQELDALIQCLNLSVPETPFDPFTLMTINRDVTTEKGYKDKWKEIMKFFYMIGDYQSAMLVDREKCPTKPLPFRPEGFAMYLDYRCCEPGTLLKKPDVQCISTTGVVNPVRC